MSQLSRTCSFGASSKAAYYSLSACFLKLFDSPAIDAWAKNQASESSFDLFEKDSDIYRYIILLIASTFYQSLQDYGMQL